MQAATQTRTGFHAQTTPAFERGPRILARTLFRELKAQGFTHDQIVALASELLGMVNSDLDHP